MARPPIIGEFNRAISFLEWLEEPSAPRPGSKVNQYDIYKKDRAAWRNERVMRRSRGQDPMSDTEFHRARDYVLGRTMGMQPGGGMMKVVDVLRAIVDCSSGEDERIDDGNNYKVIDQNIDGEKMGTSSKGKHVLGIERVKLI